MDAGRRLGILIKTTLKLKFLAKLFRKNDRAMHHHSKWIHFFLNSNSELARYYSMYKCNQKFYVCYYKWASAHTIQVASDAHHKSHALCFIYGF